MRTRPNRINSMSFKRHVFAVAVLLSLLGSLVAVAQTGQTYPYTGMITGSDVHIRSGAGTNFYKCGKLNQGDKVEVLGEQGGWTKITPPPGSFSWIAMQYVAFNMRDPYAAIVTGDNVSVYAGADNVEPMHSTSKQGVLKRGTGIQLMDEEKDGYYKIVPPAGSFLWVSSLYVEHAPAISTAPPVRPVEKVAVAADANQAPVVQAGVMPGKPEPKESKQLKAYYVLQEKTKAELTKPLAEQDYAAIKKELAVLAGDKESSDVSRYAKFLLGRIERYELAQQVSKAVAQQGKDLKAVRDKLKNALAANQKDVPGLGRFAVIGMFKPSSVYNTAQVRRYRILDANGKTRCYAEPASSQLGKDFESFVGKKVGLVGKIKPFPAVNGALVMFTEVVEIP